MLTMWLAAHEWILISGVTKVLIMTFGIHVFSWIIQFVGHGVFEGRKPALLDSLVQSVVLAPLFVWLHVLFFVGYRPQLQHEIDEIISKKIKEWHSKTA